MKAEKVLRKCMPSPSASFWVSVQVTTEEYLTSSLSLLPVQVAFLSYKGDQPAMG